MGRMMPVECEHGRILDWGDFGGEDSKPETCETCEACDADLYLLPDLIAEIVTTERGLGEEKDAAEIKAVTSLWVKHWLSHAGRKAI